MAQDIRVLHLISGGDTGGAKTHVISLVKGLNQRIGTRLITLMASDFTEDARALDLPVTLLNQKNRFDLTIVKKLKAILREENINIIHTHGARANFIATFLKKDFPRLPIVTTIHSDYLLDDYRGGPVVSWFFRKINYRALRSIDYYIGVSDAFKDMMIKRGFGDENRVFSVYNGVDFALKDLVTLDKTEFLRQHGIEDRPQLVYVGIMGRLDPVKNHHLFLETAKEAYQQRQNLRFLIAGEGGLESELRQEARALGLEKVVGFLGFLNQPNDFYNAIDINVMTSKSESFPYAMLEGARLKKPLVTTDVGGLGRVIRSGETGYLVKEASARALSLGVVDLADHPDKRQRMGENLYQVVKENFSLEGFIQGHIKIYEKLLEENQ